MAVLTRITFLFTEFVCVLSLVSGCVKSLDDDPLVPKTSKYNLPPIIPLSVSGSDFVIDQPFPKISMGISAGGRNISPGISWQPIEGAQSYTVIVSDDVDPPNVYWIVVNIPNNVFSLRRGVSSRYLPRGSVEMPNTYNRLGRYSGPVKVNRTKRSGERNNVKDFIKQQYHHIKVVVYASNMVSIPTVSVASMLQSLKNTLIARGDIVLDILI